MKPQATVTGNVGRARIEDGEWELFVDDVSEEEFFSHMSEKAFVQFLGESWEKGPWIVPNRFPPNCKAETHAHNYDTVYYILKGSMTFNDGSGWYQVGDLRWVRAGTYYGPEEAGPDGCEFLLISQGPISIMWGTGGSIRPPSPPESTGAWLTERPAWARAIHFRPLAYCHRKQQKITENKGRSS